MYQSTCEQQKNVLLDIKTELKQQFTDMFKDMMLELKHDILNSNNPVNVPVVKKKYIGSIFS